MHCLSVTSKYKNPTRHHHHHQRVEMADQLTGMARAAGGAGPGRGACGAAKRPVHAAACVPAGPGPRAVRGAAAGREQRRRREGRI